MVIGQGGSCGLELFVELYKGEFHNILRVSFITFYYFIRFLSIHFSNSFELLDFSDN